jgi:hypothetical protein
MHRFQRQDRGAQEKAPLAPRRDRLARHRLESVLRATDARDDQQEQQNVPNRPHRPVRFTAFRAG